MANTRSIPTEFTVDRLKAVRERLEAAAAAFIAAELVAKEAESGSIHVFREPSLTTGLERLEGFTQELLKSVYASKEGKPYSADTRKTRGKK